MSEVSDLRRLQRATRDYRAILEDAEGMAARHPILVRELWASNIAHQGTPAAIALALSQLLGEAES